MAISISIHVCRTYKEIKYKMCISEMSKKVY